MLCDILPSMFAIFSVREYQELTQVSVELPPAPVSGRFLWQGVTVAFMSLSTLTQWPVMSPLHRGGQSTT